MQPKRSKPDDVAQEEAMAIATEALAYIAGDGARLGRFLAETGLGPGNLRQAAKDPSFLPGVLDFVLSHERDLIDFAATAGIDEARVTRAREVLAAPERRPS